MKDFKIRCHALSKIMAGNVGLTEVQEQKLFELQLRKDNSKTGGVKPLTPNMEAELLGLINKKENPELPQGAKTYCKIWLKQQLFNRKKEWKAIVVDKGLDCELDGIKFIADLFSYTDFQKNNEFFENEFMEGSPDILHDGKVRDTKLSWDLFTFPMFDADLDNEDYWWQLQGYMILTKQKKASLDYVLINTPMPLILLDLKKLYFQSGGKAEDWNPDAYESMYPNYRFDDIPKEMRVKSFAFDVDETLEPKIKERVLMCRKYINETLLPSNQVNYPEKIKKLNDLKKLAGI